MADHPPNFWIEPDTAQHLVCGTAHAMEQALAAGCAPDRLHRASGMILRPDFHDIAEVDRVGERLQLGLDPTTPTGLVLFGGTGSRVMKDIARRLPNTPLILMCGRNDALADDLRAHAAISRCAPRIVLGHTPDVARWMQLADFFIGKPGPGSLSEAVQMGLPVIVTRNAWTMPQERWNAEWVRQHGLGVVLRSFSRIADAVAQLTADLTRYRANTRRVCNRAVFEVPEALQRILDASPATDLTRCAALAASTT
jgi:1,2-diacylglycerol 3-beta-galactosyltransferase